jgi:hypothetical protein
LSAYSRDLVLRFVNAGTRAYDVPRAFSAQGHSSFPLPLRFWIHTNKRLFARVHEIVIIVIKEIHRPLAETAVGQGIPAPEPGTISFTQRWGSAANRNPHLHILTTDGVYQRWEGKARFRNLPDITDANVARILESISRKVLAHLRRQGYLDHAGEVVENPEADTMFKEHDSIARATACSITGTIAFGPNAGKRVTRIGSGFGYAEETPLAKGRLCASMNGFSLHAATKTNTQSGGAGYLPRIRRTARRSRCGPRSRRAFARSTTVVTQSS